MIVEAPISREEWVKRCTDVLHSAYPEADWNRLQTAASVLLDWLDEWPTSMFPLTPGQALAVATLIETHKPSAQHWEPWVRNLRNWGSAMLPREERG